MLHIDDICAEILLIVLTMCDDPITRLVCKRFKFLIDENVTYKIKINEVKPINFVIPKCFELSFGQFRDKRLIFVGQYVLTDDQIKFIKDMKKLENVKSMDLSMATIKDVSAFGRVHSLNLHGCQEIKDVSVLSNVHTLDISQTNIDDVSMLGNLHELNISECQKIKDVSALGKVRILNLRYCAKITDVSALADVHDLDIAHTSVSDISALTGVKILHLNDRSLDISALTEVEIDWIYYDF